MDTSDPPGVEKPAADYVRQVLEVLIVGHLDTVNVDPKKWQHGPFSADRDGGYIYGRGTVDDKDNLTAALMVMLFLERGNVALDRDVIFLAESGEEGATKTGIEFVVRDQERILEAELHRFVRYHWDIVYDLARAR